MIVHVPPHGRGRRRLNPILRVVIVVDVLVIGAILIWVLPHGQKAPPKGVPANASAGASEALLLLNDGAGLMGQFEPAAAAIQFARSNSASPTYEAAVDEAIAVLNKNEAGAQEQAILMLDAILKTSPGDLRASYCKAIGLLFIGEPQLSLPLFQLVMEKRPRDAYAAYYTGQSIEMTGKFEEALPWYQKARDLDPFLRSASLGAQRCLSRLGRDAEAETALAEFQALADNPRSRLAEFKYTRMGSLAEVVVPAAGQPPASPQGTLFGPPQRVAAAADLAGGVPVAVDLDGDGRLDFFIAGGLDGGAANAVLMAQPDGSYVLDRAHPLAAFAGIRVAAFGDFDNDGLIDVYLGRGGTATRRGGGTSGGAASADAGAPGHLLRQSPKGVWSDVTAKAGVSGDAGDSINDALFVDLDHDGDLDLVVAFAHGSPSIFMNRLDGTFARLGPESGFQPGADGATQIAAADVNGDRAMDLILVARDHTEVWINDRLWTWRRDPAWEALEALTIESIVPFEFPEDGHAGFAMVTHEKGRRGLQIAERRSPRDTPGAPAAPTLTIGGMTPAGGGPERWLSLAVADLRGTGVPSILVFGSFSFHEYTLQGKPGEGGSSATEMTARTIATLDPLHGPSLISTGKDLLEIRPPGPGRSSFVTVDFKGRAEASQSLRSNADGVGVSFAARIGERWASGWTLRNTSGPGQSPQPISIGLGGAERIDFISMDWSDGVLQTELALKPGPTQTIVETQRQISSCPVIFAWDGEEFSFETDCLGVGGLGYLADVTVDDRGRLHPVYPPPRPFESVRLGSKLAARNGSFEIRVGEPMEEALYLDAVNLTEWRLPQGWSLALDERMGIGGPPPTGEARFFRNLMTSSRAVVRGQSPPGQVSELDQTRELATCDRVAADFGGADPRFIGRLAEPISLTLDFPDALDAHPGTPALLLDGWVEYPYCQTNFAMWQANAIPHAPRVEALDPATGTWMTLVEEYGYPAGMARQASFPLAGEGIAALPAGCRSIRLTTQMELYLDRAAIAWFEECPGARSVALPLQRAEVAAGGFARRLPTQQKRPLYDYAHRVPLWDCRLQPGTYTQFGDSTPLLAEIDDAVAILGAGEEVRLFFDASRAGGGEEAVVHVLTLNGWCKDMDRYTGDGDSLLPLPTREASHAGAPDASRDRDSLHRRFNTRIAGGR